MASLLERRGPIGQAELRLELWTGRAPGGRERWWVVRRWRTQAPDGTPGECSEQTFTDGAAAAWQLFERLAREGAHAPPPRSVMGPPTRP